MKTAYHNYLPHVSTLLLDPTRMLLDLILGDSSSAGVVHIIQ